MYKNLRGIKTKMAEEVNLCCRECKNNAADKETLISKEKHCLLLDVTVLCVEVS